MPPHGMRTARLLIEVQAYDHTRGGVGQGWQSFAHDLHKQALLPARGATGMVQWMVRWCMCQLWSVWSLLPSSLQSGAVLRWPEWRRNHPPPTVQEVQDEGVVLIARGAPHAPCPVIDCRGTLPFLHR
jgi:hypothetical protein